MNGSAFKSGINFKTMLLRPQRGACRCNHDRCVEVFLYSRHLWVRNGRHVGNISSQRAIQRCTGGNGLIKFLNRGIQFRTIASTWQQRDGLACEACTVFRHTIFKLLYETCREYLRNSLLPGPTRTSVFRDLRWHD